MARRTASTSEVALAIGLAPATVQKYARDGRIPFGVTPGGHRRFDVEEVRAALESSESVPDIEASSLGAHSLDSPPSVVILTALDVEYKAVRAHLRNTRSRRLPSGTRFEIGEFAGDYLDWHVFVAEIGEGNLGAAIEAREAISHFDPDLVLFVGVAGGFKDDLRHGDVVVASKVYDYQGGKADEEFHARPVAFATSHSLDQLVRKVKRGRWFESSTDKEFSREPTAYLKPIAAGEVVVTSKQSEIAQRIKRHYNDTTAVEMESAGMYMAAQRAGRTALAIRGISDLLDDKDAESDANLQPVASRHAAAFAFALLSAIEPEDLGPSATPTAPPSMPNDLLSRVPPNVVAELRRAKSDSAEPTDVLLRRLANDIATPTEIVERLVEDPPEWLAQAASPHLWAALGEFATAHDVAEAAITAFVRAANLDGAKAPEWMARAAQAAASRTHYEWSRRLIAQAREMFAGSNPFVNVIEATIQVFESGDISRASQVLEAAKVHGGDDPVVKMMWGQALFILKRRTDALTVYEGTLKDYPTNTSAALAVAETLLARCAMEESDNFVADLERAQELALQARDRRRAWRGDSAEAAAVAAKVAIFSGDLDGVLRVTLPPPKGEATEAESGHSEVLAQASRALLFKGDTQRALDYAENIPDDLERELAQAECFRHIPNSNDLAREQYEGALKVATDDGQRVQAYFGLAKLGIWPLQGVERLAEHDPVVVDMIAAQAELAQGNQAAAVKRYRKWKGSLQALEGLVKVYLDNDNVDEAVQALLDGATRHGNPELRVRAARILVSAKRYEDAEVEARRAMDAIRVGSRQHRELRLLRIQLAAWRNKWPEVEEQARAALNEGIEASDARWAIVYARYNQRHPERALEEMIREPALEPRDEMDANLAIQLHRLGTRTPDAIRTVLDLAERFSASEQVNAAAFMAALEMSSHTELPPNVLGRLRTLQSDFFERFPESAAITKVQADDTEALVEQLVEHLKETLAPEAQQYAEIMQGVISGNLPYGFMSAFAGKPYAEALIKKGAGFLPVASADAEIAGSEQEVARQALDGPVVAETSALHTLDLLTLESNVLLANFSRILIPAEALDDAIAGRDSLNLRSTGMMSWDPQSDRPTLSEVDEEQAEAWASAAERLVATMRKYEVISVRHRKDWDDETSGGARPHLYETPEAARPWLAPIEVAKKRGLPLLSDDFVLRTVARLDGVAAFGTLDLLTVLADRQELSDEDFMAAVMDLRRNYAVDLPLDEEQILTLAAEDEWRPGPAALVLTRPVLWQDPVSALKLYNKMVSGVLVHDESLLPHWCMAAVLGFSRNWPPAIVTRRAGRVLAHTMLMSSIAADKLKITLFSPLLAAARRGARSLGGDDPLSAAVESLREMLEATVGAANAAQVFAKLVEGLDSSDRSVALEVFLRPSRP